jgi:hypothetical protein
MSQVLRGSGESVGINRDGTHAQFMTLLRVPKQPIHGSGCREWRSIHRRRGATVIGVQ